METKLKTTEVFKVNLATDQMPEYSLDKSKGIIKRGKKNNDPNYLLALSNNHAEHGAIVRGKAKYVTGIDIKPKEENPLATEFLKRANPFESWQDLRKKYNIDRSTHGGYFLKIETNIAGIPINWYHVPYNSVCVGDDFESYKVCDDWINYMRNDVTPFPKFREGHVGDSIFYYKEYYPAKDKIQGAYAQPEYRSCVLDIDTDVRLGSFSNNFIKNNFSSGTMIIIPNGETDKKKKDAVAADLKGENTGEDNAGNTVVVFTPKDGSKDVQVLSLNANDLANQHSEVRKTNKEKIVAGHGVNGALFKIKLDDKALFSREELAQEHELFINEYAKVKQSDDTKQISKWFKLQTGQECEFEVEQIELIGLDLPLDNQVVVDALNEKDPNIIPEYLIRKYSIKIPEKLDANGQVITTPVQEALKPNSNLKGLTAEENRDIIRICRDFQKGKLNQAVAMARLRAFGFDDMTAKEILDITDEQEKLQVQQSAQKKNDKIEELFLKYAHDIEGEVLEVLPYQKVNLATALEGSITDLRNAVLNQLKGNPFLKVDELAKLLEVDTEVIQTQIDWLSEKKLIEIGEGSFSPTKKALNKDTEDFDTEIVTEYTYEKRPDVTGPALLSTSRPDCVKWYNLTRTKAITYEAIKKLENEFGDPAWDFRGGFFNDSGITTPWCRHYWMGRVVIRKKKK